MQSPASRGIATLFALLADQASASPDHDAVAAGGTVSYASLLGQTRTIAQALHADGFRAGDRLALLTDNRPEWISATFAAASLGGVSAPINTWVKRHDLEYLLGHSRPTVLITAARLGRQDYLAYLKEILPELWTAGPGQWHSPRFPELHSVVVIGDQVPQGAIGYQTWISQAATREAAPVAERPGDIALVLYTSGSSARPKAVPLIHGHLIDNGFEIGRRQGLGPSDRVFLASPLCWAFGGANALMATLTHGATLVLQSQFDAAAAVQIMRAERCTSIYTLPVMTHALLDQPDFLPDRIPTLSKGLTLGPPAEIRLAREQLGAGSICNIYGSTETYGNCCVTPHDAPASHRDAAQGPPLDGMEIRIADPDGAPMTPGQVGEILVRGRITPGYLASDRSLAPAADSTGFYRSGDLGWLDESGWLIFAARETEMIKTSGINVSPSEVEEFMHTHPAVADVAVVGADDPVRGQQVVAFVRLRAGSAATPADLRDWCKTHLASYKAPRLVVELDEFPTTPTGKLGRRELGALAARRLAEAGQT
jgi:fatty-acyl-CoA synthase